jgi:hypothetical protein
MRATQSPTYTFCRRSPATPGDVWNAKDFPAAELALAERVHVLKLAGARWGSQGDGRTKGERIQMRARVVKTGPGAHFVPLVWPPNNADWPQNGEPDYVEFDPNSTTNTVRGWLHVQNGGSSGHGSEARGTVTLGNGQFTYDVT